MPDPISCTLHSNQQKAVMHGTGPMCVIAGPGSGKTTVIVNRIQTLISHHKSHPDQILVITFTKAAAIEMKERFTKESNGVFQPVMFGTFHAVFFQILKHSFHYQYENILTPKQKHEMISEVISGMKESGSFEYELNYEEREELLSKISNYRNQNNDRVQNIKNSKKTSDELVFEKILKHYDEIKKKKKKIDFDDLIVLCHELLMNHKKELEYWQKRFTHILVDEFQDINPIQYQLVQLLAQPENNLFVVGDDDQAIYRFRGADPSIMLHFKHDFPQAKELILDVNYRSTMNIVDTATTVIRENEIRFQKEITSLRTRGNEVVMHGFSNIEEEKANIVTLLKQMLRVRKPDEIAILTRTISTLEQLTDSMSANQIPFQSPEKLSDFYSHFISDTILSYIRYALTGKKEFFLKIMNKPVRYISRTGIEAPIIVCNDLLRLNQYSVAVRENIKRLEYDCEQIRNMNPYAAVNYIRKGIGYEQYLMKVAQEKGNDFIQWKNIMDDLQKKAAKFTSFELWFLEIEEYQNNLSKNNHSSDVTIKKQQSISLMTFHASKGLEWPCIILPDLNEGIVPHSRAFCKEEIEEERRMLYVAMTRAKDELYLFWVNQNRGKEAYPSRFLQNIMKKE